MTYARSNPHRFTTTRAAKAEIDEEFNTQTGWINDTSRRLDTIELSGISGADNPANAGKVPVTDGYRISWKKVDLSYLTPQSMNDTILQDRSITNRVMGVRSIGSDQLMDNCITERKVPHSSLPGTKIRDHSLPLSKFSRPTISCLIGGTTTDQGSWYPCRLNPWEVPTLSPGNGGPLGKTLDVIWNNTSGSFHGNKIAVDTLPGTSLANQTITASKIAAQTITGDKIAAQTITGSKIANQTITGDKIADASIPASKLSGFGVPFCAGLIKANGQIENGFNISRVSMRTTAAEAAAASGPLRTLTHPRGPTPTVYTILFERPARSTNYIVMATPRVTGNPVTINIMHASVTTHQFEVLISDTEGHYTTSPFSFVVYQS